MHYSATILEQEDALTEHARSVVLQWLPNIAQACKIPQLASIYEDYALFQIEKTEPSADSETLLKVLDIPRILTGELGDLSASERQHVTKSTICYNKNEAVVVDWNCAFLFESLQSTDTIDLLELALMQLLELRVYNDVVERALKELYSELESGKSWFRSSQYQRLSHKIMRLFVDILEISERIDNALQFLGDPYLARIHRLAVTEFNITHSQKQLRDKLEILRQINELLVDQISSQKSLSVEIAIVCLIVLEILFALFNVT